MEEWEICPIFLHHIIFTIKKRSDNCEYCTQTSPNQPKPIGMINSDKNLPNSDIWWIWSRSQNFGRQNVSILKNSLKFMSSCRVLNHSPVMELHNIIFLETTLKKNVVEMKRHFLSCAWSTHLQSWKKHMDGLLKSGI